MKIVELKKEFMKIVSFYFYFLLYKIEILLYLVEFKKEFMKIGIFFFLYKIKILLYHNLSVYMCETSF